MLHRTSVVWKHSSTESLQGAHDREEVIGWESCCTRRIDHTPLKPRSVRTHTAVPNLRFSNMSMQSSQQQIRTHHNAHDRCGEQCVFMHQTRAHMKQKCKTIPHSIQTPVNTRTVPLPASAIFEPCHAQSATEDRTDTGIHVWAFAHCAPSILVLFTTSWKAHKPGNFFASFL